MMEVMNYKYSIYNLIISEENNKLVIFNTKTNAICKLEKSIYKDIHNATSKELITLSSLGIIVTNDKNEYKDFLFQKNVFVFEQYPEQLGFIIAPTLKCNMRCSYCFENDVPYKGNMSQTVADEVISFIENQITNNKQIKTLHIRWFGGEPCLAIDTIEYISRKLILFCDEKNINYNSMIVSNGLLLNRNIAELLKNLRIRRVQITIDGLENTYAIAKNVDPSCFAQVVDNIANIYDLIKVIVRVNIDEQNIEEAENLARYLLIDNELNGKIWLYFELIRNFKHNNKINALSAIDFESKKNEILQRLINDGCIGSLLHSLPRKTMFSCGSMQCMSATIGPTGELYRCDNGLGKKRFIIGTCHDGFFRNDTDIEFLLANYKPECETCSILPICGGGCMWDRLIENNQMSCSARKQRVINDVIIYLKYKEMRDTHGK